MRVPAMHLFFIIALSPIASAFAAPPAIPVGQIDTFASNTAGWTNGNIVNDPTVVAGGPAGASDNYMRFSSDGSGSGGKLTAFNTAQWIGDYLSPGITSIEMDLRNLGSTDLQIRLGFKQTAGFGAAGYCSLPFLLPVGGGWVHAVFPINSASFDPINGPASFASVFGGDTFGELRLMHATTPLLTGTNVVGSLGVDNIRAVPTPSAAAALILLPALVRRRRR